MPLKNNTYRNAYFHLLDAVVKETGNSKKYLHEWWLKFIFPFLLEDEVNNFSSPFLEEYTTKCLSEVGWENMYKEFKEFCLDKFNIT